VLALSVKQKHGSHTLQRAQGRRRLHVPGARMHGGTPPCTVELVQLLDRRWNRGWAGALAQLAGRLTDRGPNPDACSCCWWPLQQVCWSSIILQWHNCQSYQAAVYKQCLGVPRCTPNVLAFFEMRRNPLQVQWLARTLRYWNKLAGLSPHSLPGGTSVANVAAGLGCGRTNPWAAELRAALQLVCPGPGWTAHMLQGKPIDVAPPVVAAAQQAFCAELRAYGRAWR
jgi:hypothetical protein